MSSCLICVKGTAPCLLPDLFPHITVWGSCFSLGTRRAASASASASTRRCVPHSSHLTHHSYSSHLTHHSTTHHTSLITALLITPLVNHTTLSHHSTTHHTTCAAGFRVAGAVHRAFWRSCGARGRRLGRGWLSCGRRTTQSLLEELRRARPPLGPRLAFVWQAQYTKPPFRHHFVTYHFVTHHLSHHFVTHYLSHTQLCHTPSFTHTTLSHPLFHTPTFTHNFVIHTIFHTSHHFVTHHTTLSPTISLHTQLSHTTLSRTVFDTPSLSPTIFHTPSLSHHFVTHHLLTHHFVTHHLSHTIFVTPSLSHTIFSHTSSFTPLCPTPSFTTPSLAHTMFHHTIFDTHTHSFVTHHLSSTSSFVFPSVPVPATTFVAYYWTKLTCGVIRSFYLIRFDPFLGIEKK